MRVPLSWLAEYVNLPAEPAVLIERLTLAGLESASLQLFGLPAPNGLRVKPEDAGLVWPADQVVVARVLKIEKHPDADKLKMVTLDRGTGEPKTVITGAPNIEPGQSGMKVVLGLRGTKYYYTDKDGKKAVFTLEPKALRGIMNDAMCMSNFELGIADDHEGIIILDDNDPEPGTPLQKVLGEVVVDLDVLPNMARCLGMLGIAREVAALCGGAVREPELAAIIKSQPGAAPFKLTIYAPELSARYTATILRNVQVGPAPRWMRSRLHYAGIRPINNIVDITNYVMLEYGQPLHAFDYDVLVKRAGGGTPTITVRLAKASEKLRTLDGVERELGPTHLVIADGVGPIALAGVMGGAETEVTADTKSILLESASFDIVSVRQTARQFTLFSEASTRFSRGIHPEIVPLAARRAELLLQRHAGGESVGYFDVYPVPMPARVIELQRSEIERVLGVSLPDGEVERVLTALQFQTTPTPWGWSVVAPTTRLDIQAGAADLIEELARVSGYDRLPGRMLALELPTQVGNRDLVLEERVRDLLADLGLSECITYALTSTEVETKLHPQRSISTKPYVTLVNPGAPERSVLRQTLLPGLLAVAGHNIRNKENGVALFELGPVFFHQAGQLPDEPRRLSLILAGARTEASWDVPPNTATPRYDFFDLKGVVEGLLGELHLSGVTFTPAKEIPHLHPGRAANVLVNGATVGAIGELHPKAATAFELTDFSILVAELDLDAVLAAVPDRYPYRPVSTFPPVLRDVAVVLAADVPAERVLQEIKTTGGDLLEAARLFDVYRGDSIPPGTKSLAFALTYRLPDRQLNDKEVDKTHQKIEGRLKSAFQGQIRGKEGT